MTTKEKAIILFAITCLANDLNIKDTELSTTKNLTNKFNKILEKYKNIFNNEDNIKQQVINLFKKYVNKLNNNNDKKGG